jgi:hypothetical protein
VGHSKLWWWNQAVIEVVPHFGDGIGCGLDEGGSQAEHRVGERATCGDGIQNPGPENKVKGWLPG